MDRLMKLLVDFQLETSDDDRHLHAAIDTVLLELAVRTRFSEMKS